MFNNHGTKTPDSLSSDCTYFRKIYLAYSSHLFVQSVQKTCTMMNDNGSSVNGVLAMNQRAACLMRLGSYGQAVSLLKEALRTIKAELLSSPSSSDQDDEAQPMEEDEVMMSVQAVCIQQASAWGKICADSTNSSGCGIASASYGVIDRAFIAILESEVDDEVLPPSVPEHVTRILIYNMALVYHIQGLRGALRDQNYRQALALYDAASHIHFEGRSKSDCLVQLAIVNNKAHIHQSYCRSTEAQLCAATLGLMLEECVPLFAAPSHHPTDLLLNEHLLVQFHRNILWLLDQHTTASAA